MLQLLRFDKSGPMSSGFGLNIASFGYNNKHSLFYMLFGEIMDLYCTYTSIPSSVGTFSPAMPYTKNTSPGW